MVSIHAKDLISLQSDFYKHTSVVYDGAPMFNLFSIKDVDYNASLKRVIAGLYTKAAVRNFDAN